MILPHTVSGHEDLLRNLPKHVVVWTRESVSYHYLKSVVPYPENIFLSHDMAFALEDLQLQGRMRAAEHIKVTRYAFREDVEQHPARGPPLSCNEDLSVTCDGMQGESVEIVSVVTRFIKLINTSDAIYTDRLHVGIVASILGKEVRLFSGSYYKVQAVYDHSMRNAYKQTHLHTDFSALRNISCSNASMTSGRCKLPPEDEDARL